MLSYVDDSVNAFFFGMYKGHPAAEGLKAICITQMKDRMGFDTELADKLIPDFSPGCRRLTPGDGYLEAFAEVKVVQRDLTLRLLIHGVESC